MGLFHGLFQRDIRDVRVAIDHEVAVFFLLDELEGLDAELGSEDAVVGQRGAAALQVAEHRDADVVLEAELLEFLFQHVTDAAELDVLVAHGGRGLADNMAAHAFRTLCNDDVAEAIFLAMASGL